MISQTDIIKTLVNKNCTDESVLSTALSKECTPTKLLEKLAETERFDLALDISMKSGLDVIPLWRTWAMRCLKNRNFRGAREKFRHCFPRLRLPGYRVSPAQSGLLADILKELSQMNESQLSLSDEIELIKQRNYSSILVEAATLSVASKPTIFAECLYYMKEYGGLEDRIKFHMKNRLWDQLAKILLENTNRVNIDKFFLGDMVPSALSHGYFGDFVIALHKSDPDQTGSLKYFRALYGFCRKNRRVNLLYFIQSTIGDHIGAANTQINLFFLKRPYRNYRELNSRLAHLIKACDNYEEYSEKNKCANSETLKSKSNLFENLPQDQVEQQLKLVNLQIEITRNFSINEVSGCINAIEVPVDVRPEDKASELASNDTPATFFDSSERRKTFLAALVIIYFDLSCSTYFSKSGLDLAKQIINDYKLDKIQVFKTAMRIVIEDESYNILENARLLLDRLREDYVSSYDSKKDNSKSPSKLSGRPIPKPTATSLSQQVTARQRSSDRASLRVSASTSSSLPKPTPLKSNSVSLLEGASKICDDVIRDSIRNCREPDYKMELAKLLSSEAKIELYIELGKLSNAQQLAFSMKRPDYVSRIIEEAIRLNQNHVRGMCDVWMANNPNK